ncbi:hypothetical protein H5410_004420 [Solanum commersonii]|uniref:Uncharacterized protein n=1 Tax=Solanum commersonii TaxID=4109 RepID=A0A9J6B8D8_SOLCO|nr:hypothetical protein H5410_004420 [Solanum commersonii]
MDRIHDIFTELTNMRHHLSEIDCQIRDVMLRDTIEEFFYPISRYSTYLDRKFELEYKFRTEYNFFYRRKIITKIVAPSNNNGDRIHEICTELTNMRQFLSEIDCQIYSTYLDREFELEYEHRTDYNFFYRIYH